MHTDSKKRSVRRPSGREIAGNFPDAAGKSSPHEASIRNLSRLEREDRSVPSEVFFVTFVFGCSGLFSRHSLSDKPHSLYPVDLLRLGGLHLICD
jgi:hypothetical protein